MKKTVKPVSSKPKSVSARARITNLDELREHALLTLERLERYEITVEEAGVIGKVCEGIMSTVKTQMEYARMVGKEPEIEFIGECTGNISKIPYRRRHVEYLEKK